MSLIPGKSLLTLTALTAAAGLFVSLAGLPWSIWAGLLALAAIVALVDAFLGLSIPLPEITRDLPGSIPLDVSRKVTLKTRNTHKKQLQLSVYDHYPDAIEAVGLPISFSLEADESATFNYLITARERGRMVFRQVQIRHPSPLNLWQLNRYQEHHSETRVYPNFAAVSHLALLATDNRLSQLGIIRKRRRGEGQDFHQLREYREGDSLRQVDWKATSRSNKLISRDYQDERDQEIIFLLDSGQRMLAKDDELSHFDHTLNAILLLAYVALRQGDSVGLSSFGSDNRWLSPRKGQHAVQDILNTVYDLQPTTQLPDYSQAATELLLRHKKRALVILLTNVRDEDSEHLLPAIRLLRQRHLLLLASLKESALNLRLEKPAEKLEDALGISATHLYLQQRQQALNKIRQNHVITLDIEPSHLSVELINAYLGIKSSGML